MTQYMLSVCHSPNDPVPDDPEEMQKAFKQVDAFNAELQAAGPVGVRRRPARAERPRPSSGPRRTATRS